MNLIEMCSKVIVLSRVLSILATGIAAVSISNSYGTVVTDFDWEAKTR